MASFIDVVTTGVGMKTGADSSGILELRSDGVTKFTLNSSGVFIPGSILQVVNYQTGAVATGATAIPQDDTIPQITEGNEYMILAITPKSATSLLLVQVITIGSPSGADWVTVALFQDATANALAATITYFAGANEAAPLDLNYSVVSGSTTARTFRVRGGCAGSTFTFNGASSARRMGGVASSSITIMEIAT